MCQRETNMSFEKETNITLFFTVVVLAFTNGLCYYLWQDTKERLRVMTLENRVMTLENKVWRDIRHNDH